MILYHGSTAYHILYSIVHKVRYHYHDKAVLFISEYMAPQKKLTGFVKKIQECHWFEDIWIVPERTFRAKAGRYLTPSSSITEIEGMIEKLCTLLTDACPYSLEQFSKIYIAADLWTVGTYLLKNHIPYYYMEDASGMLSEEKRYLKLIRDTNLQNYTLFQYLQGAGRSNLVLKKLCDLDNQQKGFYDEKAIDFSIHKAMKEMDEHRREEIISLYDGTRIPLQENKNNLLFLTQYHRNLEIKSISMQKKMTYRILDYFGEDCEIIIKPHPKDGYLHYETMFPGCTVVNRSVPSELLPFILDGPLELAITPNSTSIGGIRHKCSNILSFGEDIEVYYERLHLYYVVISYILQIYNGQQIAYQNINEQFLLNFLWQAHITPNVPSASKRIFIDGGSTPKMSNLNQDLSSFTCEDTIFFLELEHRFSFFALDWITADQLLEITITLTEKSGTKKETSIWLYSPDETIRRRIQTMKISKTFSYSGDMLEAHAKSVIENQILKGKLRALEYVTRKQEHIQSDKILTQAGEIIEQYKSEKHFMETVLEKEGLI